VIAMSPTANTMQSSSLLKSATLPETPLSILYVEDSEMVRNSTMLIMESYFAHIDVAVDGEEGYEQYLRYHQEYNRYYDIVFTDLNMPRMDGIGLSEAILKKHPSQNIVVISAHDESEYLIKLINLGISNFILKPINMILFDKKVTALSSNIQSEKLLRKKRQELLTINHHLILAKKEAEQASIAKSRFLANMSHEIRTPLNAINGFIHLLKEDEADIQKKEYFNIISDASSALLHIISDILDLSKIESRVRELENIDFSPKKCLMSIGKLFQAKAIHKGIAFNITCDENMPATLRSDIARIKQVLSNLLSNALKFTPEGGEVSCILNYHDGKLDISVHDNGIGIPIEKQKQIFEPFSQVDDSTSRLFGGTGLGLSISIKLASMLGGTLEVDSQEGKGSKFTLLIPISTDLIDDTTDIVYEEQMPDNYSKKQLSCSANILIAEDNEANAMFIGIALKKANMTYDVATDGAEAVKMAEVGEYDLILMDDNMPKLSGTRATKAILAHEALHKQKHTPIIAVTANALRGDRERYIDAGMDGYLSKPVDPRVLIDTICTFLMPKKGMP